MKNIKTSDVRHDRGFLGRTASNDRLSELYEAWARGLSGWLRSRDREVRQLSVIMLTSWIFAARRLQPVPVIHSTRYSAATLSRPRWHFVRI
jgi:hypothetical protein